MRHFYHSNQFKLKSLLAFFIFFFAVLFQSQAQTYCASGASSTADDDIFNVTIGILNNTSTCSTTGGPGSSLNLYSDYTTLVAAPSLVQSSVYTLSVTVGMCGTYAYSGTVVAFIDFNKDGDFLDAGETVWTSAYTAFALSGTVVSSSITIPAGAPSGPTRMRIVETESSIAPTSCGTNTWGETEDYNVYIGTPPAYDIALATLIAPTSVGVGNNTVTIKASNFGTTPLTSADFGYSVNGGTAVTENKIFASTAYGSSYTYSFTTPLNLPTAGTYSLKFWVRNPNGVGNDANTANDSVYKTVCTGISGAYTINPSGSGSTNYLSFSAAAVDLNNCGVSGPITFTVAPGTYTEKLTLTNVLGTSAVNTITFDGLDSAACIITYNQTVAAANPAVINLIGTSYVTIKNLKIIATGASTCSGVNIQSGSNFNNLLYCAINVSKTLTVSTCWPVGICGSTYSTVSNATNNLIQYCSLSGGYLGLVMYGNNNVGNRIKNSNLTDPYYYGIYAYYQNNDSILSCRLTMRNNASTQYAIYSYYNQNNKIDGNIINNACYYGMYVYNNNNLGTGRLSISNNILNMNATTPYTTQYGMYVLYCVNVDVVHNTVFMGFGPTTTYGCYVSYGTGQVVKNNIFHSLNVNNSYIIYIPSTTGFTAFDHNVIYNASSATFAYWNSVYYTDFASLKAAAAPYFANSIVKVANFVSLASKAEDLHLTSTVAADYGDGAYTTAKDVDGEARCPFAPTIGADESKFGAGAPTANYTAPDSVFINSPIAFLNNNGVGAPLGHKWYIDGVFKGTTLDLPYKFTALGTYIVKLVTTGCFGIDSITKSILVSNPTQKPLANFIADVNTVETYQNVSFKDLTIKGPTYWYWTFSPSAGVNYTSGTNNNSQNPVVNFANPGVYQVCMWDSNAIGRSVSACKTAYVLVKATNQMCIFPFDTKVSSGTLYDDGGPLGNYGANHTATSPCTFLIDPCASSLTLKFSSFNLGTGALLKIYNGKDKFAPALHTGTGFTGTAIPTDVVASSGKMYIEFVTSTTLAAGFAATWTSVAGNYTAPAGTIDAADTLYDCGAAADITFTPSSTLFEKDGAYYKWYYDYANSPSFPDYEGKGAYTGAWSYGSTGIYKVRCEIEACGGTLALEKDVIVDHPTRGPLVNFKADLTTATPTDLITLTDISKYDPIYRRWKITGPSVPVVITGNNTTKIYSLKFLTVGAYTVELFDSNCVGSSTLTKVAFINIIDYCTPAVSTLNADFAIEKTSFGRIDTLINGTVAGFSYTNTLPAIGTVAYRNNTAQIAGYTVGNTSITKTVEAIVDLGGSFNFAISRSSNYNPANFKMWIDYNQDGTFQSTEMVASSGSITGKTYNGSITIPTSATIGNTRMRIGTAFDNLSNTPCGANQYGEFNDFRVRITPDLTKPTVNFNGADTIFVEVGRVYTDPGYTVSDNVTNPTPYVFAGLASGTLITKHPFNSSYTVTATDGAGNITAKTRIIRSTADVTKPVITMKGSSPVNLEVKSVYSDSGATASDFYFGNFTPFIVSNSTVNVNKEGTYTVTYNVSDSSGNAAITVTRTIIVKDTQKPVITLSTADTIYINVFSTFNAPVVTVTDNYYSGLSYTTSGATVNTNVLGTYVINYNATDSSGNIAVTKKLTVIVRDTKAPTVFLALGDTVVVDVNTLTVVPEPGYFIYDNYYPTGLLNMNVNYGNVKLNVVGDYAVRYYVSDPSGNIDSSHLRIYRVLDRVAPVINVTGSGYVVWQRWKSYVDAGNTVTDNYYTGLTCTPDVSKVNIYLPGVYEVTYNFTDASGNKATEKKRLVEITAEANGISAKGNDNIVSVYPNPSHGMVTVELNITDATNANIMVFDANGKVVYTNMNVNPLSNKVTVDMSKEAAGMYFVKVVTNTTSVSKSFTIQK